MNRNILVFTLLLGFSLRCSAQISQTADSKAGGIKFENGINWEHVKAKAKQEGKFIFVDCFATWCLPCKKMDREVYTNDTVGSYMNARFISVKVQMDTSKNDNAEVQAWYADAHKILQQYQVNAYPTYLFFSADGEIVHKEIGARIKDAFISIATDAIDPSNQYYTLLRNYQQGKKDYKVMAYLANAAKRFKDNSTSAVIAQDYINNYLYCLSDEQLFTKENINFVAFYIKGTKEKAFNLFYNRGQKVDSAIEQKGFSQMLADMLITREMIEPVMASALKNKVSPDWKEIRKAIAERYSAQYADRTICKSKVGWYYDNKDWKNYVKSLVEKNEKYEFVQSDMTSVYLNNDAFEVFKYSNDKVQLQKALAWSKKAIELNTNDPNFLDTYANLLYKLGRKKDAIALEEKAIAMNAKHPQIPEFIENLTKMKKGENTWPEE